MGEWVRCGLRGFARFLNRLAGPEEAAAAAAAAAAREDENEEEEEEEMYSGPLLSVVPEIAFVVAAVDERVDSGRFCDAERLVYSLDNLPSKEQAMEDLKKKTGLTKCEFFTCIGTSDFAEERPFEMSWTPHYYNLVKVSPLE